MQLPRPRRDRQSLRRLPIAFIHQDLGLIDWMTVAENICLTLGYPAPPRHGRLDARRAGARQRALEIARRRHRPRPPHPEPHAAPRSRWSPSPARSPPRPRSWCSTSRPPACRPTRWRGCSRRSAGCATRGVGMIYVSHRLDEVFEIADRMVVLRDGRVVGERAGRRDHAGGGDPARSSAASRRRSSAGRRSAKARPRLRARSRSMIGRRRPGRLRRPCRRGGRPRRAARRRPGDSRPRAVRARPDHAAAASCSTARRSPLRSPREAMASGINLVCADRVGESVMSEPDGPREPLPQSRSPPGRSLFSFIAPGRENRASLELGAPGRACGRTIRRCRSSSSPAATSRRSWSAAGCISAPRSTSSRIRRPASTSAPRPRSTACSTSRSQAGAAIVIVSTDFEEVAKVCHRALVFDRGRVVAELGAADLSVENLLAAASASIGHRRQPRRRHPTRLGSAMQSIKSNALEPTRSELAGAVALASDRPPAAGLRPADPDRPADHLLLAAPAATPSRPTSTSRSILADKAIIALLSLAATLPMMAGRIDLTVGFGIVMWHILAIGLQVKYRRPLAARRADRARLRRRSSACSTACWSRSRRSTPSSPRSAPAPCSTRWRSGTPTAARSSARCRRGFIAINTTVDPRHSDPGALRARRSRSCCGSSASGCRSAATSTPSAPTRRPPRSTASRCAPTSSACSSPRG